MAKHWGVQVAQGAVTINAFLMIAKGFGLVQAVVIANRFGAGMAVDAYALAFSSIAFTLMAIPRDLLAPFLPVFTEERHRAGEQEAWRFAGAVGTWLALLIGAAAFLGFWHADTLVRLVSQFESEDANRLAASLVRIMMPAVFFMALYWLATLLMHAYKRFGPPAAAEVVNKIALIACILALYAVLGIRAVAVGVALGALTALLFPVLAFGKTLRLFRPSLDWKSPAMRSFGRLVLPILIGTLIAQSRVILNYWFASGMGEGMTASLNYAKRLSDTIVLFVPFTVGTAIYPFFSEMTARKSMREAGTALAQMLRLMALLFVPLSVGLGVLRVPAVQILFHHGAFTIENVYDTAAPFLFYTVGLVVLAWEIMLMRFYFSAKNTLTPIAIGLACTALHVALVAWLRAPFGHAGIPMAETLSKGVKVLVLLALVRRIAPPGRFRDNAVFAVKLAAAAVVMGLTVQALGARLGIVYGVAESAGLVARLRELGLPLVVCAGAGLLVFAAAAAALRIPEARLALDFARTRLRRRTAGDR